MSTKAVSIRGGTSESPDVESKKFSYKITTCIWIQTDQASQLWRQSWILIRLCVQCYSSVSLTSSLSWKTCQGTLHLILLPESIISCFPISPIKTMKNRSQLWNTMKLLSADTSIFNWLFQFKPPLSWVLLCVLGVKMCGQSLES